MNFDTSPRLLARLNDQMRSDPRVIRWTMLKLGEKLEDVVDERVNLSVSPSDETSDPSTSKNNNSLLSSSKVASFARDMN